MSFVSIFLLKNASVGSNSRLTRLDSSSCPPFEAHEKPHELKRGGTFSHGWKGWVIWRLFGPVAMHFRPTPYSSRVRAGMSPLPGGR